MKNVTQNFINDIKTYGRQFDFNVAINNESISNDNINYIKPAFYTSNENNKTALFTTIMQQLKIDTKNELAINSKIEIEAGIKVNESNYQYISYNPYTVSSCEKQEDTNSYVSLAYDKMIESMIDYDLELSEKITVRNYLILICNRLGWSTEHIPSTFINHNKLVDPALHQGINYTFRMALDEIATITCSFLLFKGEDFYLIYPTETNQIIDSSFLDEDNVNIGERYFINSLVFSRAEGSDNIYRKDNKSIENNGLHEFKISNNQLLSTNDRDIYIDQMFNYLKTFEFYTFDVQSKGILFLEACDRFTFNLSGNTYSTILLNNEQEFEDGLIEKLYVDRPEETETEYKYADETDKRINQTYLIVDKQNQKIESLVNNIQIGGTNILRGTDIVTGLANQGTWANGTWRSATGGNGTRERIDIIDSPNANIKKGWRFTRTAENNSSSVDVAQDSVPVANGQTYTMSCWVRNVSGNTRLRLQYGKNPYRNNQPLVTNTSWKKYTYTFTVGEQSDGSTNGSTNIYFGLFQDSVGVLEICGLKLESGNKATDWSPAPEDIESNLQNNYYTKTETESKIEQKADSITSTVSQTYSTKTETTQAKNEAINSANTATDNKLENYSTTTQMNSAITQKANKITSTVTTLENKVNNMQVGGRNYLKNSKTTTTLTKPASSYAQYNWDSYHPLATKTLSTSLTCTLSFRFIPTDENYRPCTSIVVGKNANGDIWSKRIYYSDLKVKKYSDYYFYYASFTIPATEGAYIQSFIKFILSSSDSANLGGQVSHLKLEDGNMPTDWTPAPEDIENELDTNYYTKTETESKIEQKADSITSTVSQTYSTKTETTQAKNEAINSANTATDNKLENYSTTTQMNSAITQKANKITSTVSTIEAKLDNIQVGGTNLLRGTNTVTTLGSSSAWSNGTWRNAGAGTGTRTSISVSDAPNANIKVGWSTSSTSGQVLISQDNVPMTNGEKYILSCYAKGTGSILLQYGNGTVGYTGSNIQITDENNWKKYSYTFTSRGTANIYFGSNSAGNNVSFCGMKLEKGNMATDWSPAPEDIESNLTANYYTKTETNSQITQKANEISSVVSQSISAVQVGGTNLVKNSAPYSLDGWTNYGATTSLVDESTAPFKKAIKVHFSDTTQTGAFKSTENRLEVGKEYSWSVYVKSSKNTELTIGQEQGGTKVVNLTTSWQKFTYTFTADNEPHNNFIFYCYSDARQNGLDVYIHSLKLEEGNKITSWSINPNDEVTTYNVISKINQSAEAVGINANKIELSANDILNLLAGNTINLTSKNIVISSNDLRIDSNGNIEIQDNGNGYSPHFMIKRVNNSSLYSYVNSEQHFTTDGTNDATLEPGRIILGNLSDSFEALCKDGESNISLVKNNLEVFYADRNGVQAPSFQNTSLESIKKNISKFYEAIDILKNSEIYQYNLKTEKDTEKKHIGFVIGESYKTPKEIMSSNMNSIDIYSMVSVLWRAVQEQQEIIEDLKSRIEKLEKKVNK